MEKPIEFPYCRLCDKVWEDIIFSEGLPEVAWPFEDKFV